MTSHRKSVGRFAECARSLPARFFGRILVLALVMLGGQDVSAQMTPGQSTIDAASPGSIRAAILYRDSILEPSLLSADQPSTTQSWLSFDKVQHVTFGFLFTLGYQYSLVNKLDMSERTALPLSVAGTAAIGIGKELIDWKVRSRKHFSTGDLVADSIGILLAVGLIAL